MTPILLAANAAGNHYQPDLFGYVAGIGAYGEPLPPPPLARASDPPTSRSAAERHARTGRLGANAVAVLALVQAHPGSTFRELFSLATADVQKQLGDAIELMRRLGSLRASGRVRHGEPRACRVRGTQMVTWTADSGRVA